MHSTRWTSGAMLAVLLAALVASAAVAPRAAGAQAVIGLGDDALGVPRGHVRLTIGSSWSRFDRVFDADGERVPLGAKFALDSLSANALEAVRPLEQSLRALSGIPDVRLSLGRSVASVNARVTSTPIIVEAGIASRLTIGVVFPLVQTRSTPHLNVNPTATGGNVSVNPATTNNAALAENTQFFQQLMTAQAQLGALIAACLAGSSDARCPAALAQGPALQAQAIPFGADLQSVFSGAFVPLVGTPVDLAMRQRLTTFTSAYNTLLGAPVVTIPGPRGATLAFTTTDFQNLLTSAPFAFQPFTQVRRESLGDVELRAQLQVINTLPGDARLRPGGLGFRLALGGLVRLGTGSPEAPDNLIDIGTGDGQTDIEARAVTDLIFGPRLWLSVAGRYGWQMADELPMRIAPRSDPFPPAYTQRTVSRDLGDYIELEATPRLVLSRYFMLGAQYVYRRKSEDRHTGSFVVENLAGETVTLDASVLDQGTRHQEHHLTGGVVFSTVAAYRDRRARWPLEISYRHGETVTGSGGMVPKAVSESIQARVYVRLFGPDDRPPAGAAPR